MTKGFDKLEGPRHGPASGAAAKQLIVLLHGVGADGNDLISLAQPLAQVFPDAAFVSPHGPFPFDMAPMGRQWFSLGDWSQPGTASGSSTAGLAGGARTAAPILDEFLDTELKDFGLSDASLGVIGFSQGTMMALHCCLRRPKACAAVIGFSGLLIAPETLTREVTARPPVTLIHGTEDQAVPFDAMAAAAAALAAAGVPHETFARPGLGHSIDQEGLSVAALHLQRAFAAAS